MNLRPPSVTVSTHTSAFNASIISGRNSPLYLILDKVIWRLTRSRRRINGYKFKYSRRSLYVSFLLSHLRRSARSLHTTLPDLSSAPRHAPSTDGCAPSSVLQCSSPLSQQSRKYAKNKQNWTEKHPPLQYRTTLKESRRWGFRTYYYLLMIRASSVSCHSTAGQKSF